MSSVSTTRLAPHPRVVSGSVAGTTVLFQLDRRRLHVLNDSAGESWAAFGAGETLAAAAARVAARYRADPEVVLGDLAELVDRLVDTHLLYDGSVPDVPPPPDPPPRLVPRPGVTRRPEHGSFRALDAHLVVESSDPELAAVVGEVLEPLWSPEPAVWAIEARPDDEGAWEVETRHGHPAKVGSRLAAAFRVLAEVNSAAVESVPECLVLHAGAVSTGQAAVVLPAAANHGKSTLTTALVRQGFSYLTDEAAAIDGDGRCLPYPKAIALDPGSFSVHPELAPPARDGLGAAFDSRAWHLPAEEFGTVGGPVRVAAVVMPRWRPGSELVLTRCSPEEAVPALVANAFAFDAGGQGVFEILCDLAERVPVWRLAYGDLRDAVGVVSDLLGG